MTNVTKEYHIHNLILLPPRQNINDDSDSSAIISLPPLRADEAVSSLRAALVDIVGFGQLTKFRFVVESRTNDNSSNSKSVFKKKDQDPIQIHPGVNRYTLRQAVVSVPPSLKAAHDDELAVLDDYGDLSVLVDLLDANQVDETAVATAPAEEEGASSTEAAVMMAQKVILDASSIAVRVVLEPYDVSSIREQIGRVRALLGGNAPALTTLVVEEDSTAADENGQSGAAGSGNDGEKEEVDADTVADEKVRRNVFLLLFHSRHILMHSILILLSVSLAFSLLNGHCSLNKHNVIHHITSIKSNQHPKKLQKPRNRQKRNVNNR
jgi:hypothetical protein